MADRPRGKGNVHQVIHNLVHREQGWYERAHAAYEGRAIQHVIGHALMARLPESQGGTLRVLATYTTPSRPMRIELHEMVCDCGHGQSLHRQRAGHCLSRCAACDTILALGERTPRGDACIDYRGATAF